MDKKNSQKKLKNQTDLKSSPLWIIREMQIKILTLFWGDQIGKILQW